MAITNFGPGTFVWTDGAPTHNPDDGAKFAIDVNTYVQYEWVSGTTWVVSPISVKKISGTSAPTGAPGLHDSQLAINEVPELYYYFSGSWHLVSGGGGGSYTDEQAQDAVGGILTDTAEIDLTYNDATPSITADLKTTGVTAGTYNNITVDSKGRATSGSSVAYLTANQTITLTGDVTGSGTTGIVTNIAANAVGTTEIADDAVTAAKIAANAVGSSELQSTTVVPGSYTYASITVDTDGRLTSASSGTTPLAAVTTDASLTGTGTGGSPLGISFPILAPDGSAAAPSYAFVNSAESGLFYESPNLKLSTAAAVNISAKPGLGGELSLLTQAESGATAPQINVIAGNSDSRDGGRVNIYSGDGSSGGVVDIKSGTGASGPGGDIFITGGDSTGADGSNIAIAAGSSDQNGGDITITSGASTDLNGGDFTLQAGGGATGGGFTMFSGAGTTGSGGSFSLNAGNSTSSGGGAFNAAAGNGVDGGGFGLFAGDGTVSGGAFSMESGSGIFGGNFTMSCGASAADDDVGGNFTMSASNNSGINGEGGQFFLNGGDAPNGVGGGVVISPGSGSVFAANGHTRFEGKGVIFPPVTNAQKATSLVTGGLTIYNSDNNRPEFLVSQNWKPMIGAHAVADHYTDANNTGTTETDLYSYTLPANYANANGDKISAEYGGTFNDATATVQLKIYFDGVLIGDTGALTLSGTGSWDAKAMVIRTGNTTGRAIVTIHTPTATAPLYTLQTDLTGLDFTATSIFKITGTAGGAGGGTGDITLKLGTVIFTPKA